jgi:hypothetical protein
LKQIKKEKVMAKNIKIGLLPGHDVAKNSVKWITLQEEPNGFPHQSNHFIGNFVGKKVRPRKDPLSEIRVQLTKLCIKPGDVLLVKFENSKPGLQKLLKQLRELKLLFDLKTSIFVLPSDITLETMSEEEMNRAGWIRKSNFRALKVMRRKEADMDRIPKEDV